MGIPAPIESGKPRGRWPGVESKPWTPADLERLRSLYPGNDQKTVAELMGRSYTSVKSKIRVLRLGDRKYWSAEEAARLKELYPNTHTGKLAATFGRKASALHRMALLLGVRKSEQFMKSAESGILQKGQQRPGSVATQFKKGQVPLNKGLRRPGWAPGRMAETQFKKGHRPHTWKPLGAITSDEAGYLRMKVKEHGPGERGWHPAVWPLLHHLIWIENNGPVPARHRIVFKDGNRKHCSIENLECISISELGRRNIPWNRYPRELALVVQLNGVLKRKLRSIANGKEQDVRSA